MKKERKEGQVTIFVIIAIVIIAVVVLGFVFREKLGFGGEANPPEIIEIQNSFEECLDEEIRFSLEAIALQGGYYELPEESLNTSAVVYLVNNEDKKPSLQTINSQIILSFNESIGICLTQLEEFANLQLINITSFSNSKPIVSLSDDKVSYQLRYTMFLEKNEASYEVKKTAKSEIVFPLKKLYDAASSFVEFQKNSPSEMCITCIEELGEKENLDFSISEYNEDTIIIFITDKNLNINDEYKFAFAIKYTEN